MNVEIPACPPRGGFAVFFDAKGNINQIFVYKDRGLVEIKNSISKEEFFKRRENVKFEDWGSGILPVEVKCSPRHWVILDGQKIWAP